MPKLIDISGNRYGHLIVLYDSGKRNENNKVIWHCKCDCGNECDITKDSLKTLSVPSCGCQSKKKSICIGDRFGKLLVTRCLGTDGERIEWECLCDCGKITVHTTSELNSKKIKSCGCLKLETGEKLRKYNSRDRKLYYRWSCIKGRCYNPNDRAYKNYGGRGIEMCQEWKNDFFSFRNWAISNGYDESLSIDRIDNNKNYCPDNCRWTDDKTQSNNRRSNHYITINGITKTMMQWAEEYNINYHQVQKRIASGWSEQDAITIPIRPKKARGQGARFKINHPNEV